VGRGCRLRNEAGFLRPVRGLSKRWLKCPGACAFLPGLRLSRRLGPFPQACVWGYLLTPATWALSMRYRSYPRLTPGATIFRPLRGLYPSVTAHTPGLRPGLPSFARYVGSVQGLPLISQAWAFPSRVALFLQACAFSPRPTPGATIFRPLRGLSCGEEALRGCPMPSFWTGS
jgi:hypothetical protein